MNESKGYLRNQISTMTEALLIDDKVLGRHSLRWVLEVGRHRVLQAAGIEDCIVHTEEDTRYRARIQWHSDFVVEYSSEDIPLSPCSWLYIHLFPGSRHHEQNRPACCLAHGQLESGGHRTYQNFSRSHFAVTLDRLTRCCSSSPAPRRLLSCR